MRNVNRVLALIAMMGLVGGLTASAALASGALEAPRNVSANAGNGSATIEWSESEGAVGYNVYRDGSYLTTVDAPPYTDSPEAGNHRYYITAFDQTRSIFSGRSNEVSVNTRAASTASPAPSPAQSAMLDAPEISFGWGTRGHVSFHITPVDGAAGYNIYRHGQYHATVHTPFYAGETGIGAVNFSVAAFNEGATVFSPTGPVATFHTSGGIKAYPVDRPDPVTGLQAEWLGTTVELTWADDQDDLYYRVFRNGVELGSTTSTIAIDTSPEPGATYTVRAGRGGWDARSVAASVGERRDSLDGTGFGEPQVGVVETREGTMFTPDGGSSPGQSVHFNDGAGYRSMEVQTHNGEYSSIEENFPDGTTRVQSTFRGEVINDYEQNILGQYERGSIVNREPAPLEDTVPEPTIFDDDDGPDYSPSDDDDDRDDDNDQDEDDDDDDDRPGHNVPNPGVCVKN